jgi:hypothetical protein
VATPWPRRPGSRRAEARHHVSSGMNRPAVQFAAEHEHRRWTPPDVSHMGIVLRNTWPQALCKRDTGEGPVGNRTWAVPG